MDARRGTPREYIIPMGLRTVEVLFRGTKLTGTTCDISKQGLGVHLGDADSLPDKAEEVVVRFPVLEKSVQAMCVHRGRSEDVYHIGLFVHQPFDQDFLAFQLGLLAVSV